MSIFLKYIRNKGFTSTPKTWVFGFTLLELLVVMTIATILMTIFLFQQKNWDDHLSVTTQIYELSLMIRQAQFYSLGVRENVGSTGDKFNIGYGIYISQNSLDRYIIFADKDKDKRYDLGEEIETKILTKGVVIDRFCGISGVVERCGPDAGNMDTLHISFLRPELKANVIFLNVGTQVSSAVNPPGIIYLRSPNGKISRISVLPIGQIIVTP